MIVTCTGCGSDNEAAGYSPARCSRCDSPLRRSDAPATPRERDIVGLEEAPVKKKSVRYWIIGFIIGLKLLFVFVKILGLDNDPPPPEKIQAIPVPDRRLMPEVVIKSFELFELSELPRGGDGRRHFKVLFNRLKPVFMHPLPVLRIEMGLNHRSVSPGHGILPGGPGAGKIDFALSDEEIPPGTKELVVWLERAPMGNIPPRAGKMESNEVRLKLDAR